MNHPDKLILRDYQIQIIQDTYRLFRGGIKSILIYAPTGAGKTAIPARDAEGDHFVVSLRESPVR